MNLLAALRHLFSALKHAERASAATRARVFAAIERLAAMINAIPPMRLA